MMSVKGVGEWKPTGICFGNVENLEVYGDHTIYFTLDDQYRFKRLFIMLLIRRVRIAHNQFTILFLNFQQIPGCNFSQIENLIRN